MIYSTGHDQQLKCNDLTSDCMPQETSQQFWVIHSGSYGDSSLLEEKLNRSYIVETKYIAWLMHNGILHVLHNVLSFKSFIIQCHELTLKHFPVLVIPLVYGTC